jgi:hypothetical protein
MLNPIDEHTRECRIRSRAIDGLDLDAYLLGDGGGIDMSPQVERKKREGALVDVEALP